MSYVRGLLLYSTTPLRYILVVSYLYYYNKKQKEWYNNINTHISLSLYYTSYDEYYTETHKKILRYLLVLRGKRILFLLPKSREEISRDFPSIDGDGGEYYKKLKSKKVDVMIQRVYVFGWLLQGIMLHHIRYFLFNKLLWDFPTTAVFFAWNESPCTSRYYGMTKPTCHNLPKNPLVVTSDNKFTLYAFFHVVKRLSSVPWYRKRTC